MLIEQIEEDRRESNSSSAPVDGQSKTEVNPVAPERSHQEPVAWLYPGGTLHSIGDGGVAKPLYLHPPQQQYERYREIHYEWEMACERGRALDYRIRELEVKLERCEHRREIEAAATDAAIRQIKELTKQRDELRAKVVSE